MRIACHASHRAMEHYLYNLLAPVEFLRYGADGQMFMRPLPENCKMLGKKEILEAKPNAAIARDGAAVEFFRENNIPTIYYLSGPPQPGQKKRLAPYLAQCQAVTVYSDEHKALWAMPSLPPIHVCRYPIDVNIFRGYNGHIRKALMVATMPMSWWENKADWKGVWLFRLCLEHNLPMQLIGFNNDEPEWKAANPYPIQDEATMVHCLGNHTVYAHTGNFLCRSPLEAAAVGAPVVIRLTECSHYLDELPHGLGVYRAQTTEEFLSAITYYLSHPGGALTMGAYGRARIARYFSPAVVRQQWLEAIQDAIRA